MQNLYQGLVTLWEALTTATNLGGISFIAFAVGLVVGALVVCAIYEKEPDALERNGLKPQRVYKTNQEYFIPYFKECQGF